MLPHHDQESSDDRNQTEHGRMLSSNMPLLNLILLIDVTFSTPRLVSSTDSLVPSTASCQPTSRPNELCANGYSPNGGATKTIINVARCELVSITMTLCPPFSGFTPGGVTFFPTL